VSGRAATVERTERPESPAPRTGSRRRGRLGDRLFSGTTALLAVGLIALLALLLYVLGSDGSEAFGRYGLSFITGRDWNPVPGREQFGALPFIFGTVVTSATAIALAVPVAVGLAVLMNESRTGWLRAPLATFVDLLAAIPSVVYGLWALFVLKPIFDHHVEPFLQHTLGKVPVIGGLFSGNPNGGDLLTAGVILAIMILPIVTAVGREIIAVVPREMREGAKALGATRYETIRMAVLPYARSGIVGASVLGLGRALGETIAVAMVIGGGRHIGLSLFGQASTIPSVIASEFREATSDIHRSALMALALILVTIAFLMAVMSRLLVARTERILSGGESDVAGAVPATEAALESN
jgi:phosphate transport system permease protein